MAVSTHYPPCEQGLAAVGVGACLLRVVNGLWGRLVVMWRFYGVRGCVPCGYPAAQASRHLPGVFLAPNEPLTSHLNGEEGAAMHCALSL